MSSRQFILRGLGWNTSAEEIVTLFDGIGVRLDAVAVYSDHYTGRPRGFALIESSTQQEVERLNERLDGSGVVGRRPVLELIEADAFQRLASTPRRATRWKDQWYRPELSAELQNASTARTSLSGSEGDLSGPRISGAERSVAAQSISGSFIITGDVTMNIAGSDTTSEHLASFLKTIEGDCRSAPWVFDHVTSARDSRLIELTRVCCDLEVSVPSSGNQIDDSPSLRRLPFLELVRSIRAPRLFLLGDFGAGKTTLLKTLAVNLARQSTPTSYPVWIPLSEFKHLIDSSELKQGPALIWMCLNEYLSQRLGVPLATRMMEVLPPLLVERGLFLFDGFDELSMNGRESIARAIKYLTQGLRGDSGVILAGRTHLAKHRLSTDLRPLILPPLDIVMASNILASWLAAAAPSWPESDLSDCLRRTIDLLNGDPALAFLSRRPLFLTMLTLLLSQGGVDAVKNRSSLYESIVSLFLRQWVSPNSDQGQAFDSERANGIPAEATSGIRRALEDIAFRTRTGSPAQRPPVIDKVVVYGVFADCLPSSHHPVDITKLMNERIGIFEQRSDGYRFVHESIREYLAACRIADMTDWTNDLSNLVDSDPTYHRCTIGFACEKLSLSQVNRVIPFLLRKVRESGAVTPDLMRAIVLAEATAQLLSTEKSHIDLGTLRTEVAGLLLRSLDNATSLEERAIVGDLLGQLGDLRPGVGLRKEDLPVPDLVLCRVPSRQPPPDLASTDSLWMSKYPITVAQYRPFVESRGYEAADLWDVEGRAWLEGKVMSNTHSRTGWLAEHLATSAVRKYPWRWREQTRQPNLPVVGVSWFEASAYCRWLVMLARKGLFVPGGEVLDVRLPTEDEWLSAATPPTGFEWPWGQNWKNHVINTHEAGLGRVMAVGLLPESDSPCGLSDLLGNSWDWTSSDFDLAADTNCESADCSSHRRISVKGGSWTHDRFCANIAFRDWNIPEDQSDTVGFRVAVLRRS